MIKYLYEKMINNINIKIKPRRVLSGINFICTELKQTNDIIIY